MKRLAALVLAVFSGCLLAQAPDLAVERTKHLQHGINASLWFAQSTNNYTVERLRTFTTDDDIALMERLGFDHVRLSIDAAPLVRGGMVSLQSPFVLELDRVVDSMLQHRLAVIVDIHPESSYKAALTTGTESVDRFTILWSALAKHFSDRDPAMVFFEIMNEPEQSDPYRWIGIEARVAEAIRSAAPHHTIIATGGRYSGLSDLLQTEPVSLPNVIYTFHDYEPFAFTHQGATWTDSRVQPLRAVPYPSSPALVEPNLKQEPNLYAQYFVEDYGMAQWNAEHVQRTIAFAAKWGAQHHVPVYCGEFGVLRDYVDPQMRATWLHDMRIALEKNGIGWAMWDYQTNFGIVRKQDGKTTPDATVVQALGLHAATP